MGRGFRHQCDLNPRPLAVRPDSTAGPRTLPRHRRPPASRPRGCGDNRWPSPRGTSCGTP